MATQHPLPASDITADIGRAGSFKKPEMPTSACMSCNRRKLKCDREASGCSNCVKSDVTCIYPPQKRAARRKRGPYNKEKTRRERELEASLKSLGLKSLELTENMTMPVNFEGLSASSLSAALGTDPAGAIAQWAAHNGLHGASMASTPSRSPENKDAMFDQQFAVLPPLTTGGLTMPSTSNGYQGALAAYSPEAIPSGSLLLENQHDLIFGSPTSSSAGSSLFALHPPASQILEYWQIFTVNIDPVTKILHVPTFGHLIIEAKLNLQNVSTGLEALLFAIYFAAVTSLTPSECQVRFTEEKETLLARYKVAVEKALGKSNLLTSQDLSTLQALTLYLSCLRVTDTSRLTYTLTGLALRLAKSMDLHLDDPRLNMSPLEHELRKRLWWTICSLECRSAEEYGFHPSVGGHHFDCNLPLNLNDADLDPDAVEMPEARIGTTEMTWVLVRFELARIIFRVWNLSSRPNKDNSLDSRVLDAEKERILDEGHRILETGYLQFCKGSRQFEWMCVTFTRLMISKLRLILHHPFNPEASQPLPRELKDRCFQTSIEIIEQAALLKNEPRIKRWTWVFQNHHQWQALSFILSELCHRTGTEMVERAWRIVDDTVAHWDKRHEGSEKIRQSVMWEPMNRLLSNARTVREQDLISRQTTFSSNSSEPSSAQTVSPNFDAWTDNNVFNTTEAMTVQPSSLTTQNSYSSWDSDPWFGSSISSDMMLSTLPTLGPESLDSGLSTPLQVNVVPTRTNSDLQSLVDGFGSLRPDEVAALFENYPMSY